MVFTVAVRMDERTPSRRAILRAAAGAATAFTLAGCDLVRGKASEPAAADPLAGFYASTVALVRRYEATRSAHAALVTRLEPVLVNHRAHLAALATDMALPTASVGASSAPVPDASTVPAQAPAALAALVTAEKAAIKAAADACLAAPGWRAPLLGSIAACRTTHLELLA